MSKIFFCGDTHGQFQHIVEAVKLHHPKAIVMLGDIQANKPLQQELDGILDLTDVWYIHGNHDTDSDQNYDNLFNSELKDRNLHGRVVEIAGYKIAGLGGVFRGQVWMPPNQPKVMSQVEYSIRQGNGNLWRCGVSRKHRSTIFPEAFAALSNQYADILVTHEAPSCHPHGFKIIDTLARSMQVQLCFHGHHHDSIDYTQHYERMGFECHGVALRSIFVKD